MVPKHFSEMDKKISISIHDLKMSDGINIEKLLKKIVNLFCQNLLTLHLIIDEDPTPEHPVILYLIQELKNKKIEVVFHGISHVCLAGTAKHLHWFHKDQAEFLAPSYDFTLAKKRFEKVEALLNEKTGICPPCWLTTKNNRSALKAFNPLYIESLTGLQSKEKSIVSSVISLGSNKENELYFLKCFAKLNFYVSLLLQLKNIRLVIHTIDIPSESSLLFFTNLYKRFISKGYRPVLQKEML